MELLYMIKWLIFLFLISFLMRPYLRTQKLAFFDAGFSMSLGLGTALSFYISWILSAIGWFPFDEHCLIVMLVLALLPAVLSLVLHGRSEFAKRVQGNAREDLKRFLTGFLLFMLLFLMMVWIRGYKPELTNTTEQYMDFGFVKTIYRQRCALPDDIWFSGKVLNYYYLGQACTALVCRLSGVVPEYGYSFMLSTIFAGAGCMAYSIAAAVVNLFAKRKGTDSARSGILPARAGGLFALLGMTCAGNGHYLLHGLLMPLLGKITGNDFSYRPEGYFFADSTVYIGNYPDLPDKGKNEFLAYSVIIADLHAHMINLLFVLPLVGIALDYAMDDTEKSLKQRFPDARYLLIAVLLSLYMGSNYWDFPIYFVIAGALILFHDLTLYRNKIRIWQIITEVLIKGALILGIAKLLAYPFESHFEKMASEICLCQNHTPFYKFAVLWGIPFALGILFFVWLFRHEKAAQNKADGSGQSLTDRLPLYALCSLFLCATGLTLVPEVIYVRDIYGDEFARFNTMFKLTYQAFWIFALLLGIAVGIYIANRKRTLAILTMVPILLLSSYLFVSIHQFIGYVLIPSERVGGSATDFLSKDAEKYALMNALYCLNEDPKEHLSILECAGESYTSDCSLSAFSGACTYIGWNVHEWMWRGNWDIVGKRVGEVRHFYESGDTEYCDTFVKEHGIDYIFAGPNEYAKYAVDMTGFESLGEKVFLSEEGYCLIKIP